MVTMTTTTTASLGGDERLMATAQQIMKSLNTNDDVRDDMLMILSSFDNRFSNLSHVIQEESNSQCSLLDAAETVILGYGSSHDEAHEFLTAVDDIVDLLQTLTVRSADDDIVDRAERAVQVAMSKLEDEFRHILIVNTVPLDVKKLYGSIRRGGGFSLSFASSNDGDEELETSFSEFSHAVNQSSSSICFHERPLSLCHNSDDDSCFDLIKSEAVDDLKVIAEKMIRSRYEEECVQIYCNIRRDALDECLFMLGVEKLGIEEVQKIDWTSLDEKMKKWIQAVKICVRVILTREKRLCDNIFCASDSAKETCFKQTAKGCVMRLLNFGEAVSIGRRSAEKLFRILDMFDALADVLPDLQLMIADEFVRSEAEGVLVGLGEAAKGTFYEFENAVKGETSKKPMLNGEIHPIARYVMNYVKLLADYSDTLNSLLKDDQDESFNLQNDDDEETTTPLRRRLLTLLSTLESNLQEKSRLYEDGAMRYVFLMNNILYMVQKVKDSDLIKLAGDQWVRKRGGRIRQCATAYLRAAWSRALSCLKDEGMGGSSGHTSKTALKERFKNFNACFEDIYKIQTGWKVPDPQLREELRISISENVLPAYRAFLGRFGSQLENERHAERYMKYTADDLENYLLDLFEGNPLVLHHPRRKGL